MKKASSIVSFSSLTSLRSVTLGALLALSAIAAHGAPAVASPLGIEIGKTTCAQAEQLNKGKWSGKKEESVWAGGAALQLDDMSGFHIDNLKNAIVVCDADGKVGLVGMSFDKGGMGSPNVQAIAQQLDAKYLPLKKSLPDLGGGYALWKSTNGNIELVYGPASFEFDVHSWAPGVHEKYDEWRACDLKKASQNTANQL